jgi:hypothetical protein
MKTIWKFEFEVDDNIEIEMPEYAAILYVDIQLQRQSGYMDGGPPVKEVPCIWACVDTERPMVKRRFRLAGTGHPLPDGSLEHLGSFKMSQDRLVFHLFERL